MNTKKNQKPKEKISIVPFKQKSKDPMSKRKTLGCWGPSPDDGYNQC